MKNYFEMTARARAEMTIGVLVALQAEGAQVDFTADATRNGVNVTVTRYELDDDNSAQQDLSFELYKLNEEGTDHERRRFNGVDYDTFSCDDNDNFHFECEYVNC